MKMPEGNGGAGPPLPSYEMAQDGLRDKHLE